MFHCTTLLCFVQLFYGLYCFSHMTDSSKSLRKVEYTKGVIRSRNSKKDMQCNDLKKNGQTMIYQTLHRKLKALNRVKGAAQYQTQYIDNRSGHLQVKNWRNWIVSQ